jgi:hypothetical protein
MNSADPFGFTIGLLLPIAVLMVAAVLVPKFVSGRIAAELRFVVLNLVISAIVLTLIATIIFAAFYMAQGSAVVDLIIADPLTALRRFVALGAGSAIIWGPVLLIYLFGLAQKSVA